MKNGKFSTKVLVWLLCAVMLVGLTPITVFASAGSDGLFSQSQLSLVTDKQSTLASGVTQDAYTVFDKNGKQVKMFAATIDMSVDTVKLFTSYKDMDNTSYGMSKLTEQVAAFEKKAAAGDEYYHGTVVAGINASYYNMTTGKPSGVFVMNGNDVTGNDKSAYFAVLKDGTVKIGNADEYANDKGNIQEALGIYKMLVFDGKIVLSDADQKNTQKYPRQTIGITEDNKVILLSADGNQEPESAGLTLLEQAQVMLDLGCKWAGHLDGGGSMTYGSKPEGEDSFKIVNKPSDGSERSISNGLIVVSTAVASKTFDHVSYDVETEYATPGTPVAVSVSGVSTTGHAAEIPADITYKVTNGTYENGVLTADSVGDMVLTAVYNGKDCGSVTVHAVIPEKLAFSVATLAAPYGQTANISLIAYYGEFDYDVKFSAHDIEFTLSDSKFGTVDGFDFIATSDTTVTGSGSITATVKGTDVSATVPLTVGKGSVVLFDFEDEDVSKWSGYDGYNAGIKTTITSVTAADGMVHSGKYAMAYNMDFTQLTYYEDYTYSLMCYNWDSIKAHGFTKDKDGVTQRGADEDFVDITGATGIGMWVYIPDEVDVCGLDIRWTIGGKKTASSAYERVNSDMGTFFPYRNTEDTPNWNYNYTLGTDGWYYYYFDLSQYSSWDTLRLQNCRTSNSINKNGKNSELYGDVMQLYINDRAWKDADKQHKSYTSNVTLYIDDITVDYSTVVADREAPVFGAVNYAFAGTPDAKTLSDGITITSDNIDFIAFVSENTKKSNATGLNPNSVRVFVDGNEVIANCENGKITVDAVSFADGVHTITFVASDNAGNTSHTTRTFTVNAGSKADTIKVVAHEPEKEFTLVGSLYYIDLVATDISTVNRVTVSLKVNNVNDWEPEGIIVANGFEFTYIKDVADKGIIHITVTRIGDNADMGEAILASIPVRTWYPHNALGKNSNWLITQKKCVYPMDTQVMTKAGAVEFSDGSVGLFSSSAIQIDSEAMCAYGYIGHNKGNESGTITVTSWHEHTAEALADKAATCTEAGYTGRTFCEVCNSVVDWGTTIPATGHNYEVVDGVLKCTNCDELFNGVWTDGKMYVDGVVIADGWNGDYYYVDGKKVTGIYAVDGVYYDFGEDGKNQGKYTGLVQIDGKWYYSKVGVLTGGWQQIGENWHFFKWNSKEAAQGEYTVQVSSKERVTYQFDEYGMTRGAWHIASDGGLRYYYGPDRYVARNFGYLTLYEIDGKTYNFDGNGNVTYGEIQVLQDAASLRKLVYKFNEDGSVIGRIVTEGIITDSVGDMYYIAADGEIHLGIPGLIEVDGNIYDVKWSGKFAVNEYRDVTEKTSNGLLEPGRYYFGADGRAEVPFTGVKAGEGGNLYYYVNNKILTGKPGLVEVDGAIYDVKWSGKVAVNEYRDVTADRANGLLAEGKYYFGEDGKLAVPFTGVKVGADGNLYYYENDVIVVGKPGLVDVDGAIYDVKWSGKVAVNEHRDVTADRANGLLSAGKYYFGADGKLVVSLTEVKVGADGNLYYYIDGIVSVGVPGLVKVNGDIYDVKWSGKVASNEYRDVTADRSHGLLPDGRYYFGADGKLVSEQ